MNCTICLNKIVLVPSAKERARKHGGKPSDYTKLFTAHTNCILQQRKEETSALMKKIARDQKKDKVVVGTFFLTLPTE
jgi:hypothetical protein